MVDELIRQVDGHSDSSRPLAGMPGDVPPEHDLRGRTIVRVIHLSRVVGMKGAARLAG